LTKASLHGNMNLNTEKWSINRVISLEYTYKLDYVYVQSSKKPLGHE